MPITYYVMYYVLCKRYANTLQKLCELNAKAMQTLCKHCANDVQMLCRPFAVTLQILCKCYANALQMLGKIIQLYADAMHNLSLLSLETREKCFNYPKIPEIDQAKNPVVC